MRLPRVCNCTFLNDPNLSFVTKENYTIYTIESSKVDNVHHTSTTINSQKLVPTQHVYTKVDGPYLTSFLFMRIYIWFFILKKNSHPLVLYFLDLFVYISEAITYMRLLFGYEFYV